VSAKRAFDNGKWLLWVVGFGVVTAAAAIGTNRLDIVDLKVEVAKVETHIEYIKAGIERLEKHQGTYPKAKAKE